MKKIQTVFLISALFFSETLMAAQDYVKQVSARESRIDDKPNDLAHEKKQLQAMISKINTLQSENQLLKLSQQAPDPKDKQEPLGEIQTIKSQLDQVQLASGQAAARLQQEIKKEFS